MSYSQVAILLQLGLQYKEMDDVAAGLGLIHAAGDGSVQQGDAKALHRAEDREGEGG